MTSWKDYLGKCVRVPPPGHSERPTQKAGFSRSWTGVFGRTGAVNRGEAGTRGVTEKEKWRNLDGSEFSDKIFGQDRDLSLIHI